MIVADTDTRGPTPFHDKKQNKVFKLLPDVVLASTACTCLTIPFVKTILAKLKELPKEAPKNIKAVLEIVAPLMPLYKQTQSRVEVVIVGFVNDMGVAYCISDTDIPKPEVFAFAGSCALDMMMQLHHTIHMKRMRLFKDHPDIEKHMAYDCAVDSFRIVASKRAKDIGDTFQIGHLYPDRFNVEQLALKK